ncbi:chemotaxis protein [Novispirillum sp. DQ9]|uniref:chemotaxis protein n=1 Tax=Novispirillum sp. DQ9 TaxID=3398612 RepID=UPI003C7E0DF2
MKLGTATRTRSQTTGDLEEATKTLLGQCMSAFHAFQELGELAEDMRILSLNAELAAGRAGRAGVAVRALTQYTRQLVGQLNRLRADMDSLEAVTRDLSASALSALEDLRQARADADERVDVSAAASAATDRLRRMMTHAEQLGTHAKRIRQVAEQSAGISTNIAIEAAGAGPHEPEFRNVAETMKRYINGLHGMVERADQAVRQAAETSRTLALRLASARA